jgi:hypothetical protein
MSSSSLMHPFCINFTEQDGEGDEEDEDGWMHGKRRRRRIKKKKKNPVGSPIAVIGYVNAIGFGKFVCFFSCWICDHDDFDGHRSAGII